MSKGLWVSVITAALLFGAAAAAPWLYAELGLRAPREIVGPMPAPRWAGRLVDDYFIVEQLDAQTYALGEPRYYQGNYSYLLIGGERAVLFDGGSGQRDIRPVVRSLTTLPITVIPSHLHYDHVGALGAFERVAMLDVPGLRARASKGVIELRRYEFLGHVDGHAPPTVRVDEWLAPDFAIHLGGRSVMVLHLPGHTPTSIALYDAEHRRLFAGDFIYPSTLYAFLPGASRSAYLGSAQRLLALIPSGAAIYTAHLGGLEHGIAAPTLTRADLEALVAALDRINRGNANAEGFFPRVYSVRGDIVFATGFPWNNR